MFAGRGRRLEIYCRGDETGSRGYRLFPHTQYHWQALGGNIDNKGERRWWISLWVLKVLFFIDYLFVHLTGGSMHWKPNTDKLVLDWLANRTPSLCIRVNNVPMALATNSNTTVGKEVPCMKCIQQLRSILAILTRCLAGNVVGVSRQIMQINNNATSGKGTENWIWLPMFWRRMISWELYVLPAT